jgi:peptidoglycan hydrolase-like protein with peptidoglycan-binding domain
VSVVDEEKYFDDERPWKINFPELTEEQLSAKAALPTAKAYPVLRRGSKGTDVTELQAMLNRNGASLKVDGDYGPSTEAAVKKYQSEKKIVADGVVGKYTWKALET